MLSEKMNLFQKIADVKANIDGFTKDTKGYQYTYVSGSQVLHKIRAKMVEHNLLFLPTIDNAEYKEIEVMVKGKMKPNILVSVDLKYTWINADNPEERFEMPFYAVGHQDDASKALGTALTYSERYLLMKMFNIPTDEDDADAKQKREQYAPSAPAASQAEIGNLKKEIIAFSKLMTDQGKNVKPEQVEQTLNITDYTKLNSEDVKEAVNKLKGWSK